MRLFTLKKTFQYFLLIPLLAIHIFIYPSENSHGKIIKTDSAITVKDYTWASANIGSQGILKNITLQNNSLQTFQNIGIIVELYSINNVPLGSVTGSIKGTISPGETKIFERVKLGLMHTNMENSIVRVSKAELIETETFIPKDLISVKSWKWLGSQFGTKGILKEIVIENKSNNNYKNIKLNIDGYKTKDRRDYEKVYNTSVTIHDILPAQSTSTYTNVNAGFKNPNSANLNIYVSDAKKISDKELRYIIRKKQDKYQNVKTPNKLAKLQKYQDEPKQFDKKTMPEENTADRISVEKKQDPNYISNNELQIPEHNIQIKKFRWGSGIPGSVGIIRELTLENKSEIAYTAIDFEVEFLSSVGTQLASNDFTLKEILPPNSTKTYKNIKLGLIVILPNEKNMRITVKNARAVSNN